MQATTKVAPSCVNSIGAEKAKPFQDDASSIVPPKALENLSAKAALCGWCLFPVNHSAAIGGYVLARGAIVVLHDAQAVTAFLAKVGAVQ